MEIGYRIEAEIEPNREYYAGKRQKLGRFVLATNDLDFDPDRLLVNYKNQAQIERGFRFLKDNSFRVSEIFLKKQTRCRRPQAYKMKIEYPPQHVVILWVGKTIQILGQRSRSEN